MKDNIGRDINYLRLSVTDKCNLRCKYCRPPGKKIVKANNDYLSFSDIRKLTKSFVNNGINKIRLTGGEPLLRKNINLLVEKLKVENNINDLSMTTNGILLKKYARSLKKSGLDRVNVSLDTLDENKYRAITKNGKLSSVLKGIESARKHGLNPIKINVVLIKNFNDDEIVGFVGLT